MGTVGIDIRIYSVHKMALALNCVIAVAGIQSFILKTERPMLLRRIQTPSWCTVRLDRLDLHRDID